MDGRLDMTALLCLILAIQDIPQDSEIDRIVRSLDDENPAIREQSALRLQAFLISKGSQATQWLDRIGDRGSVEVNARLQAIRAIVERIEKCRKQLSAFEALDLPDCRGKPLVVYNTGGWIKSSDRYEFSYLFGWLLSESKDAATLLDTGLRIQELRLNYPWDPPDDWDRCKKNQPSDRPLPGKMITLTLEGFCKSYLEEMNGESLPHESGYGSWSISDHFLALASLAFWAPQQGLPLLAPDLEEAAEKGYNRGRKGQEVQEFSKVLGQKLAEVRRVEAISQAKEGTSFQDLLKIWKQVIRVSPSSHLEAKEMIAHYEQLIREDEEWNQLTNVEFAKLPPREQARRWLHDLQDVDRTEGYPDHQVYHLRNPVDPRYPRCPDQELYRLGWDALPVLMEHLDDRRPTRVSASDRHDRLALLRVGDCCRIIFEDLTGCTLFMATQDAKIFVLEGNTAEAKARAKVWLDDKRKQGEEAYYLGALETVDRLGLGAAHLLSINRERNLPRLLELFKTVDMEKKKILFPECVPYFRKTEAHFLEEVFDLGDSGLALLAAKSLWTSVGSDTGINRILELLRAGRFTDSDSMDMAFEWLIEVSPEKAVDTACTLMSHTETFIRCSAMYAAATVPCSKAAESLVACLGKKELTGIISGYEMRECDIAAETLIEMLDLEKTIPYGGLKEERDSKIIELRAWWTRHSEKIDWADLRGKMKEKLRRQREKSDEEK